MILIFVLTIHIPNLFAAPHEKTRLTILLRDLCLSAGAVAFAASQTGDSSLPASFKSKLITVARFIIAITIAFFGVEHFLDPTFAPGLPQEGTVIITMPAWIPAPDRRNLYWLRPRSAEPQTRTFCRDDSGN